MAAPAGKSLAQKDIFRPVDAGGQFGASPDVGVHTLDQPAMGRPDFVVAGTFLQS